MQFDASTGKSLELLASTQGERRGSLLAVLDNTVTASGARLLSSWIRTAPLFQLALC